MTGLQGLEGLYNLRSDEYYKRQLIKNDSSLKSKKKLFIKIINYNCNWKERKS